MNRTCIIVAVLGSLPVVSSAVAQETLQDNIVVVLDASGSMSQYMSTGSLDRMQTAKNALHKVLLDLPPTANVGLLVFSHRNHGRLGDWVYPLGPVNKQKLAAAIDSPQPGGITPLGAYLKIGADRLLEQCAKQRGYGTYRLVVVTDGEASDPDLVDRYLPDILNRGFIVDVIGLDMASDHVLAMRVHSYHRANDITTLETALTNIIAEVGAGGDDSTAAEDFELIAGLPEGIAPKVIEALRSSGNQPIGELPTLAGRSPQGAGHSATSPGSRPGRRTGAASSSSRRAFVLVLLVVAVVALLIASSVKKKRRRRP